MNPARPVADMTEGGQRVYKVFFSELRRLGYVEGENLVVERRSGDYAITVRGGRSTEELVEAGEYGYAHSCVTSENFPVRDFGPNRVREIVLLEFDHDVTSEEALTEAGRLGLERPVYEDALYFGIAYPGVQRERPIVFLHDPWFGFFGRRDVLCLWTNAGRRELGLEGFDDAWRQTYRFAFLRRPP